LILHHHSLLYLKPFRNWAVDDLKIDLSKNIFIRYFFGYQKIAHFNHHQPLAAKIVFIIFWEIIIVAAETAIYPDFLIASLRLIFFSLRSARTTIILLINVNIERREEKGATCFFNNKSLFLSTERLQHILPKFQ